MNARFRTWFLWGIVTLAVVALAWGGWRAIQAKRAQQRNLQAQQTAVAPALLAGPAEWMTLQQRNLPIQVAISGSLTAVDSSIIKARVGGELQGLTLREGDSVRKGQVIAKVDATESDARFRQAKLQADAAQAQVAIQQRQHANNQALVDKQFISPTALATSEANLQAALANHAAARAAADAARKVLDDTTLRSPIDGQIARRWVQSGERVGVDAQIVEVVNLSALELQAALLPQDSLQVRVGQNARLHLEGSAQVVRISPSAQAGSRTVPVYLRLQPLPDVQLRPGLFVQGHITTGEVKALSVPMDAVRNDQPQPYLQLVVQGAVVQQPIRVGVQSAVSGTGSNVPWVAVEGAPEGATVLLAAIGSLPAGTRIRTQEANAQLPSAGGPTPTAAPAPASVPPSSH